jgi:hypothetical protein
MMRIILLHFILLTGFVGKEVRNINQGGCGYFALKVYDKLEKGRYSIISIDTLKHIMLKDNVTGLFIDADGYFPLNTVKKDVGSHFKELSRNQLEKLVKNVPIWNTQFNRKDTTLINKLL